MNLKDFHRTIPGVKQCGTAKLKNYRMVFSTYSFSRCGGVADIIYSRGQHIEGVLYELSKQERDRLDKREGAPTFYRRKRVKVWIENEFPVWAFTYEVVQKSLIEWQPSREYVLTIWNGSKNLSNEYRKKLKENLLKPRKCFYQEP